MSEVGLNNWHPAAIRSRWPPIARAGTSPSRAQRLDQAAQPWATSFNDSAMFSQPALVVVHLIRVVAALLLVYNLTSGQWTGLAPLCTKLPLPEGATVRVGLR